MTDYVSVKNLCLHGYHGVLPEETKLGQKFCIDIECSLDLTLCTEEDDYAKAVSYCTLCDIAEEVSGQGPYRLIETLGDSIARAVLIRFPSVDEVLVRVRKPAAPIAAVLDHVEITIRRKQRHRFGISLGSNMGEKAANLKTALAWLDTLDDLEIERVSRFYRTTPWGKTDQDWFLNACAIGWTTYNPIGLHKALKRIELQLGRVPGERWGPRAIDIDLLFVDDLKIENATLTLPHRELFNRSFVLVPLAEIAADQKVLGRRIGDAAAATHHTPEEILPLDG